MQHLFWKPITWPSKEGIAHKPQSIENLLARFRQLADIREQGEHKHIRGNDTEKEAKSKLRPLHERLRSFFARLRNNFIAGVVVLIPIGITVYLTFFIIKISSKNFQ